MSNAAPGAGTIRGSIVLSNSSPMNNDSQKSKRRLILLNQLLLIPSIIAAALALEGVATKLKAPGLLKLAQSLLGLADFMKAYWWLLLLAGVVILQLKFRATEDRVGRPTVASRLRGLALAQISFMAISGAAIILTILN